jgi:ATP-dependent RNA helicase DeaD
MSFETAHPALAAALKERGYDVPTPVQEAVLTADPDRDLLVSAQTGSGKTVAFGLGFAPTLLGEDGGLPPPGLPLALVIAPTRELALQVQAELAWLYEQTGARVVPCVGGMDPRREARHLQAGCHIVVGTPGRLNDHLARGALRLEAVRALVLDEADEMLDMGFKEELDALVGATPEDRRTLLFSATLPREILGLAAAYQRNALRLELISRTEPHADIDYKAVRVAPHEERAVLVNLLRAANTRAIVFCATREGVKHVHADLLSRGFNAVALSGELSQAERNAALSALKDGRAQACIATDVAARGLDLPALDLVIHADLPTAKATLLHRSGRTGRAGRKGQCLLLVTPHKRRRAEMLLTSARITPEWIDPPTIAQIKAADEARLAEHPLLEQTPDQEIRRQALRLSERYEPEQIAAAFIALASAQFPQAANVTVLAPEPPPRPKRAPRMAVITGNGPVWFRVSAGRAQNADPRWLLPMLCKRGNVTKAEIGAIRIFDRETKFEVVPEVAEAFARAVAEPAPGEFQIELSAPPSSGPRREHPGEERAPRPHGKGAPKPGGHKPYAKPGAPKPPRRETDGKPGEQERRRKNKAAKSLK